MKAVGALVLLVLAVFASTLTFDFVNLDDPAHLQKNPAVHDFNFENLQAIWEKPYKSLYIPVVYSIWAAVGEVSSPAMPANKTVGTDKNIEFGGVIKSRSPRQRFLEEKKLKEWAPVKRFNAFHFHLLNLLFHLASTIVVFLLLKMLLSIRGERLTENSKDQSSIIIAAAVGAAVFAVHPVQVESVAWVSSFKDLSFGLFSLISIFFYLKNEASGRSFSQNFFISLIFFNLALYAKPTAVCLVAFLPILSYYFHKTPVNVIAKRVFFFAMSSLPIIVITMGAQTVPDVVETSFWARPFVAFDALSFYLSKLVLPINLSLGYGRNPNYIFENSIHYYSWIPSVLTAVALFVWRKKCSWLAICSILFVVPLLPVLGLKPFVYQTFSTVADRYLYLSMVGVGLAVAIVMLKMQKFKWTGAGATVLVAVLAVFTFNQTKKWQNSFALWDHVLKKNQKAWLAYNNLAAIYESVGLPGKSIHLYQKALEHGVINRDLVHLRIGIMQFDLKDWRAAEKSFAKSLQENPKNRLAQRNLLVVRSKIRKLQNDNKEKGSDQ